MILKRIQQLTLSRCSDRAHKLLIVCTVKSTSVQILRRGSVEHSPPTLYNDYSSGRVLDQAPFVLSTLGGAHAK